MNFVIGAIVIIIVIAGVAFFMNRKSSTPEPEMNNQPDGEQREESLKEIKEAEKKAEKEARGAESEEKKDIDSVIKTADRIESSVNRMHKEETEEDKSKEKSHQNENELREQLYRYINHELQNLYYTYNKNEWDGLSTSGEISSSLYKEKERIIEGLPSFTGTLVREYFSCIDFKEEKDRLIGYIKDKEALKKVYLQFMMPFYPYYYKELSEGGLRHTALLHPNTLRLFQQLTGKKFRPGFRNRYSTGVRAFEWDKERYKVYGKDGKLLCDAVFGTDGIIDGYGQKKYIDEKHPDWNIVEEGNWKDGTFQGGILRYEYKKIVK